MRAGVIAVGCWTMLCGACGGSSEQAASEVDAGTDVRGDAPTPCAPKTCIQLGAECGEVPDTCGGVAVCGSCDESLLCGGQGPNKCGTQPCYPITCAEANSACGATSDKCAATLDCGTCTPPSTCGGAGVPNQCGCTPQTCTQLGVTCGDIDNGCGQLLHCTDGCCTPTCAEHDACGSDRCGGDCGSCGSRECHEHWCVWKVKNEVGVSCNDKCGAKSSECIDTSMGSCDSDKVGDIVCYCW